MEFDGIGVFDKDGRLIFSKPHGRYRAAVFDRQEDANAMKTKFDEVEPTMAPHMTARVVIRKS